MTAKEQRSITYEALTEFSQVLGISSEWDALLEQSNCNRAFSCSKWFLSTPEILPQARPMVLVARRDGVISGIMPLAIDSGREAGFPHNWTAYNDIIAQEEDLDIMAGLLQFATSGLDDYDRIRLHYIRSDSNCVRAARLLRPACAIEQLFVSGTSHPCAYADIKSGYDEYMTTRRHKFVTELNRCRRRAEENGIVVRELKPGEIEPARLTEVFLSMHFSRHNDSVFRSSESILYKLFSFLFAEGRMRTFVLEDKGRIAGILVTMVGRNSLLDFNGGFLPEVSAFSPGSLLLNEAIRQASMDGLDEFDFWVEEERYKTEWKSDTRLLGHLEFRNPLR